MIKDAITDIFEYIWPMIVIVVTIIASIRIVYLINTKRTFKLYEELISLSFIIYILSLFYLVTFQDVNYGTSNYTPFKEMFRYDVGSNLFIKNVLGNILLFTPLGFYAGYYTKSKKVIPIFIIVALSSATVEFTQLNIGRTFDIDDIILNTVGGLLGSLLYKFGNHLPKFTKKTWFLNLITILLLGLFLTYLLQIYGMIDIEMMRCFS
ncbi:MAG: VanZ family protein [Firmicutes bacterium]|nr:VanZ family protein [Bacillota bacterium]